MNSDNGEVFADFEFLRGRPALDIVLLSVEPIVQSDFYTDYLVPLSAMLIIYPLAGPSSDHRLATTRSACRLQSLWTGAGRASLELWSP